MKISWLSALNLLFLFSLTASGQTNNRILENYLFSIGKTETISYEVQRIDTFTTGDVWNNKGRCIIRRDSSDTLFGFHFLGLRFDILERDLYDGHQVFLITDSSKTYTTISKPGSWILGLTGGQMVVPDLIKSDKEYDSVETYKVQNTDVIKFVYKDDTSNNITKHFKLIYLNSSTHLPIKIISSLVSLDKKQVNIFILSKFKINDNTVQNIEDKDFLSLYSVKMSQEKPVESIVGKAAPDFTLNSFNDEKVSLNSFRGKVILLDFWETWCGPCIKSMPSVEALFIKYKEKGLVVLGIMSEGKSMESAKLLVKKKGITFTDVIGDSEVEKKYNVAAVPKYVLINEEGKIIYESFNGYEERLEKTLIEKFGF